MLTRETGSPFTTIRGLVALALVLTIAGAPVLAKKGHAGHVDCSPLIDLAGGEDAVTIEVSLSGQLLRALCKFDEELYELCKEVHSIQALIVDLDRGEDDSDLKALRDRMRSMGRELRSAGWELVTRIREEGDEVQVLVLSENEEIHGLLVLVIESDSELICANIAGKIDLEAIQGIGEGLGIPGLEDLEDWKDDH